ncbi:MAG: MFS transporter [Thermoplasmatales archaeon]
MRSGLKKIYVYTFLYSFLLLNPIWVLYLLGLGFNLFLITLLDVVFYVVIAVGSMPTGRIADKIGRRISLLVSSILTGFGIILFGLFTSFAGIAVSYVLWGLGVAINSSALESLTFEYSQSHNFRYLEIIGMVNFLGAVSIAVASLVGGYLGEYEGLRIVIFATGLFVIASSLYTLRLKEKPRKFIKTRTPLKLKNYVSDRRILSLILIRVALVLNFNVMVIFKQPYYEGLGLSVGVIGFIFFIDVLLRGLSSLYTQRLSFIARNRFGSMLIFTSLTFFTIYIPGLVQNYASILFLILNSVIFGFYSNILSEEVNVLVPTEIRATVLSVIFLVSSLLTAVAEPFLGASATIIGLKKTFIIFSVVFLAISTFAILIHIKGKEMNDIAIPNI